MNSDGLDIVSVIFLGIAVVIFLYLRSILGSRTGNEQPSDPYNRDQAEGTGSKNNDNVVTMPERREGENPLSSDRSNAEQSKPDITEQINKFAETGSELSNGLSEIANADSNFDPEEFMQGAERAYEMIITAYSEGDKRLLKRLLAKDVYAGFSEAIEQRESEGQVMTSKFVGFDKVTMLEAGVEDKQAEITVKFKSSLIRFISDADDKVIEGDDHDIEKITDIWTFAHSVSGRDPNWKLISTESES